jgi:dipeptidyl aminopeptidase/acylaminoacyl peptidase
MIGTTVSHYKILERLGSGGMGVVYRAEDLSLKRNVALKFLPPTLLIGNEEKKRFSREAQAAAALSHPNIATVFAIEQDGDQLFIALEYVEGPSLDRTIAVGPMKLDAVLDIATQLCEGLQAAHEKGIVHRDIKSANIVVNGTGQVKILDFGLAKLRGASRMTKEGATVGTAAYMSPEQLRGDAVDQRTDIWSAGVLLYEMISGRLPFSAEYEQAVSYQILNAEPEPLTALRTGVPMELERIVQKMMAKSPADRYQSAREIPVDLKAAGLALSRGSSAQRRVQSPGGGTKQRGVGTLAAAIFLGVLLGGGGLWLATRPSAPSPASHALRVLTVASGPRIDEARISPDGSQVAFRQDRVIYVRSLAEVGARGIPGTKGARTLFWSPKGDAIGFATETTLWRVSASGGQPSPLCNFQGNILGAYWTPAGRIVFGLAGTGIFSVPEQGGDPKLILAPDRSRSEFDFHQPSPLPDGASLLAILHGSDNWTSKILLLRGENRRTVLDIPGAYLSKPQYTSTGFILFAEDSPRYGIWAAAFSPGAEGSTGEPFLVQSGAHSPSVADDGTLVCVAAPRPVKRLAWVTRTGRVERFIGEPLDQLRMPAISPDGKRVAVVAYLNGVMDVWIYDIQQGTQTRLPTEGSADWNPVWAPGSDTIAFSSGSWGSQLNLMRRRTDGGGAMDTLLQGSYAPASWSRDGRYLVCRKDQNIVYLDLREKHPHPTIVDVATKSSAVCLSPDGAYIAFVSEETGRNEVYVAPFPGGGRKWRASTQGGSQPRWARGGKELLFFVNDRIASVGFTDHPAISFGKEQFLFSPDSIRGFIQDMGTRSFEPTADGEHFVIVVEAEASAEEPSVLLLENWQTGNGNTRRP